MPGIIGKKTAACLRTLGSRPSGQDGNMTILEYHSRVSGGKRELLVCDNNDFFVTFITGASKLFRPVEMSLELFWGLLRRSDNANFGRWGLHQDKGSGKYLVRYMCRALTEGLTPVIFARLCKEMADATEEVDCWIKDEGF